MLKLSRGEGERKISDLKVSKGIKLVEGAVREV